MDKKQENNNQDDTMEYIDFKSLYTEGEIKDLIKENRKIFYKKTIWGVSIPNFVIYLITLVFSLFLIAVYILDDHVEEPNILVVLMSVGASAIGAVILAFFIEHSNYVNTSKKRIREYNNNVINIYYQLWMIFANRSYNFLDGSNAAHVIIAQQSAKKFVLQFSVSISYIDNFVLQFSDIMSDTQRDFYHLLKPQLVQFISNLENPMNSDNLITLLDGTKNWLRRYFAKEKLKQLLFIYM